MGSVHQFPVSAGTTAAAPALPVAIARFLGAPSARRRPLSPASRGTYGRFLVLLHSPARRGEHRAAPFGPADTVAVLDTPAGREGLLAWFRARHAAVSANTWNGNRAALRSACAYWQLQGWLASNPVDELETRGVTRPAPRARPREDVRVLLGRRDLPPRERALWSLSYSSAARIQELLSLDIPDLDLENRRAPVTRKGGAVDTIMWDPTTSGLLRRYLAGRTRGPVFLTDRRARRDLHLDPADLCPDTGRARLSYRRAEEILGAATSGWDLHDLRHSALTHAAEDGMPTALLLALSGHVSVRSLIRYTRPSIEAVDRWRGEHSPDRQSRKRRR